MKSDIRHDEVQEIHATKIMKKKEEQDYYVEKEMGEDVGKNRRNIKAERQYMFYISKN